MHFSIEYERQECDLHCIKGCPGHLTDIPRGIEIDGFPFWAEGFLPEEDEALDMMQRTVKKLEVSLMIAEAAETFMQAGMENRLNKSEESRKNYDVAGERLHWLIDAKNHDWDPHDFISEIE